MLPFPRFAYEAPDTVADAVAIAATPGAHILAGGTDLLPSVKHRLFRPEVIVSLRRLAMDEIVETEGGLAIGARCSLRDIGSHPAVRERYPALAAACRTVATSTIQRMATIGGNLMLDTRCIYYNQPAGWRDGIGGCLKAEGHVCHVAKGGTGCYAAHSADTVPALWLYGASVEIASVAGTRTLSVADMYDNEDGRTWLRTGQGDLLTRVVLPPPGGPVVHHKVRARGSIDYGALLVAVQKQGDGARAVVSAVGPAPVEVATDRAEDLPDAAWRASRPLNTHIIATGWRKHMIRVAVQRALAQCP